MGEEIAVGTVFLWYVLRVSLGTLALEKIPESVNTMSGEAVVGMARMTACEMRPTSPL